MALRFAALFPGTLAFPRCRALAGGMAALLGLGLSGC